MDMSKERTKIVVMVAILLMVGTMTTAGDTITTKSGLKYIITQKAERPKFKLKNIFKKKVEGVKPNFGDKVVAHYTGKFTDGKVFDSSVPSGTPFTFPLGQGRVIKGWDEGFALLHVGEKATFIIPYHLAYGEAGRPPTIPPKATLIFDVELLDVRVPPKPVAFETKGIKMQETASGLKYQVVNEGTGSNPQQGETVIVHYTGYLESGEVFDSSIPREQPFQFPLGQKRVIAGWDEGIALMKIGGKTRFTIPSNLAYGERGFGKIIPAKATLVFDVELLGVRPAPLRQ